MLLPQRSSGSGLGAPLAVSNIPNPVAAAAIGMVLLGERAGADGVGAALAVIAAAITAVGVHMLAHASPQARTVTGSASPAPHGPAEPHLLVGAVGRGK